MDRASNTSHKCRRFEGKTVLVTGGGGNIGYTSAERMASEGANVMITDIIDEAKLNDQAKAIAEKTGAKVQAVRGDVTKVEDVKAVIEATVAAFGRIDCLFNNAGYQGAFVPTIDYPDDDFRKVMAINVEGVFYFLKYVAQQMKKQEPQGGVILNTASQAGVDGPPNMMAYCASKTAVLGISRTAAKDLAPHGIRVNSISPCFIGDCFMWDRQCELQSQAGSQYYPSDKEAVSKQMIGAVPMRRYGSLEEVAGVVSFLLSPDSSYVSAANIQVTGGIV